MEPPQPYLEVHSPDGHHWTFRLAQDQTQVTIGRAGPEHNDIILGPQWCEHISRRHCILLREDAKWWLLRKGRHFPTLRRKHELHKREEEVHEKAKLADGDLIRILGQTSRKGDLYWEIHFCDRETTQPVSILPTFLRYDGQTRELSRVVKGVEQRILLSDQEQALVDFMLKRPGALCPHEQLIAAVWHPAARHSNQSETPTLDNLRQLIHRLRAKLEPSTTKSCFLISHPPEGYSLHTQPIDERK